MLEISWYGKGSESISMNIGDKIILTVTDTRENGAGVAKKDGIVVFVPSTVAGDVAEVTVKEIHKNYAVGIAVDITTESEYRIPCVCPSADKCGGCTLSHVSYEYENQIKRETVRTSLRRLGLPYEAVGETVSTDSRIGYRNKLTAHFDKKKGVFGLYREGTNDPVPFDGCAICGREINSAAKYLAERCSLLSDAGADEVTFKSSSDGKVTVLIKASGDISPVADALTAEFDCVSSVMRYDDADGGYVFGDYGGLAMRFSASGFRQVNDAAFSALLDTVLAVARECRFTHCADLYCGSGVIGLYLARHFPLARFCGTEINDESVNDARYNAEINDIRNIRFFCGDAAMFRDSLAEGESPELIVADPPRAGMSAGMRSELISLSPENIIYVSCNPQTMARDVKELGGHGYELRSVTPVNMFPMTKHIECVVHLSKAE